MTITIETVSGRGVMPWLDALAALRMLVFREFPYLYDGSLAYEREYLTEYADSDQGIIVLALDGDRVVGCSTGLPLLDADPAFQQPFEQAGYDLNAVFYFGESVLDQAWRGHGIGHQFFDRREAHARCLGFEITTFCAVERPADHPLRPSRYRPLDAFWQRRGYQRRPELSTRFAWKDVDEAQETDKLMRFWLRTG